MLVNPFPPTLPAGSNQQLQYNNSGAFGGSDTVYDNSTGIYTVGASTSTNAFSKFVINDGGMEVRGRFDEFLAATVIRIGLGPAGDTARFLLGSSTGTNWQIDNNGGVIRFFTPGTPQMQLSVSALDLISGKNLLNVGQINCVTASVSGNVVANGIIQGATIQLPAGGNYKSVAGTNGASATTGGLTFQNGLYTSGTFAAPALSVVTVTGATTLTTANDTVLVDTSSASVTITLPTATTSGGKIFRIKKVAAANTMTIARTGTTDTFYEDVSGATSLTYAPNGIARTIQADATNNRWVVL